MANSNSQAPFIGGSAYTNRLERTIEADQRANGAVSERITYSSVGNKTMISMTVLVISAIAGWAILDSVSSAAVLNHGESIALPVGSGLAVLGIAVVATLVIGVVTWFKRVLPAPLVIIYAIAEGILVGAVSASYSQVYDGIVMQALLATMAVCVGSVLVFRTGIVKRNFSKVAKFMMIAIVAYVLLSIVNVVLIFTGVVAGAGIWSSPIAVLLSVGVILLGGLMLSFDLTAAQIAVEEGADDKFAWNFAFSIMVSVVWIYLEVLRLIAILNRK
jgi:uncharacterized YccA/Bax inhibitor family protein